MNKLPLIALVFSFTSISFYTGAANDHHDHHDHGHKEHKHEHKNTSSLDAHVHGLANMTLAIDKTEVEIELLSPSANIVGFEHKAATSEQIRAVTSAKSVLESAMNLFSFRGSECSIDKVDVDVSALVDHKDDHHKDGHHDHKEAHHDHEEKESHSDISAHYHFDCKDTEKLTAISVKFFEQFPAIETLKTKWVTQSSQGASDLSAASNTIRLK